jgi:hypothetical protein
MATTQLSGVSKPFSLRFGRPVVLGMIFSSHEWVLAIFPARGGFGRARLGSTALTGFDKIQYRA